MRIAPATGVILALFLALVPRVVVSGSSTGQPPPAREAPGSAASRRRVEPRGRAAAEAVAAARAGDVIVLAPGRHRGPLTITRPITLRGEPGAIVDGGGAGSVIVVAASGVAIEGLALTRSGRDVMKEDAAVQVLSAAQVRLDHLVTSDVLYGIYAERATGLVIAGCELAGRVPPLDESGEGNGIHLWYCTGVEIRDNHLSRFLDAIYLSFANDVHVAGNRVQGNGRYGLHSMYSQADRLDHNVFERNQAGCALMFSNGISIDHNDFIHNRGPRTYGLLLRDCSAGTFAFNRLVDNTVAVFMDNSNRNRFEGNWVEDNGWGLLLFASCAGNTFASNSFVRNDYPVALDMRVTHNAFDDGARGNYWSEAATYDLDGNGVGDVPFCPVTAFAFVSKQYPDLAVLAKSPAVVALGVAERVLPSLRPSEAVDRFPLIRPPIDPRGEVLGAAPPDPNVPAIAATTRPGTTPAPRPAWGHVAVFSTLLAVGLLGLAGARRR